MAIRITCPGCQTSLTLDDKLRGKKVRCKSCAKVLSIPAAAKALAGLPAEEAVQDEPRVKLRKAPVPAEFDGASDEENRPAKKKKKKQKGKKGSSALILAGAAALVILLLVGGGLSAFFLLKPAEQKVRNLEPLAKAPEPKEKDERSPARIVVPKIQDGNPARQKGGVAIVNNIRGEGFRTERRNELANIGKSYVQYADEFKGGNRNMETWLEYIKTFGPIHAAVKDGYYKMNFNARMEAGSVIAYEADIDNGQKHLCVRGDCSVDHVPLAELKTILGRDP